MGRGGGRGSEGFGGRRRKLFDGDELRLLLVALIGEEPRHGYQLIRALTDRSGGAYSPSPGMIYPMLAMLADEGLISDTGEGGARKTFALTADGESLRTAEAGRIAELLARLAALAESREQVDAQPVRRAMHNLKAALLSRLQQEGADRNTMFQAVSILDEAAARIERL